jgi:hypothetical protein
MDFINGLRPRFGFRNAIINRIKIIWSLTGRRITGRRNRIFANSFPKSGTHLLIRCLSLMPGLMYSGQHINYYRNNQQQSVQTKEAILKSIGSNCFVSAHLPYTVDNALRLQQMDYQLVLMMRDPRDIVVSQYYHYAKRPNSRMYSVFSAMGDMAAGLMAIINGIPADASANHVSLANIGHRINQFLPWCSHGMHMVRYENLVGPFGGGDLNNQLNEIEALSKHLGLALSEPDMYSIANHVYHRKTNTFRKGIIGDWRNHFLESHKDALKEVAGQILIDLGYENDMDW